MMKRIILHIPHSSVVIPFYDGYLSNEDRLKQEQLLLTDWFTDDLFSHETAITVMAPFSRLFCDVERFADDSKETMSQDLCQDRVRPDYNLGTDDFHTSNALAQIPEGFFGELNLTVGINTPYSGSIVPLEYYRKDKRVQSIMLEVSRKLYLVPGTNVKSANYFNLKATVNDFIARIISS